MYLYYKYVLELNLEALEVYREVRGHNLAAVSQNGYGMTPSRDVIKFWST